MSRVRFQHSDGWQKETFALPVKFDLQLCLERKSSLDRGMPWASLLHQGPRPGAIEKNEKYEVFLFVANRFDSCFIFGSTQSACSGFFDDWSLWVSGHFTSSPDKQT